jgi:hypothetical protein
MSVSPVFGFRSITSEFFKFVGPRGQKIMRSANNVGNSNIFIFMTVTNNIYQKQIKDHVFNAVTNSELTELVPVFTIRSVFMWSFLKHYDGAQPGKRKMASASPTGD